MIDKNLIIGSGVGVLAIFGLWYSMRGGSSQDSTASTVGYSTPIYGSMGGGSTSANATTSATDLNSAQVGDLTALLKEQAATERFTAESNAQIGLIAATGNAAAPVLARTADMKGRGQADTILYDPIFQQMQGPDGFVMSKSGASLIPGASGMGIAAGNQRIVRGADSTMTLDYTGTSSSGSAGNTDAGAPTQATFTAHLSETLPAFSAQAAPAPTISWATPAQVSAPPIVQSSGKSGRCYITTAVTKGLGLPDDNVYLRILRNFRDDVLAPHHAGRKLIADYYAKAPAICAKLEKLETGLKNDIYREILYGYIVPCACMAHAGKVLDTVVRYRAMVDVLHTL